MAARLAGRTDANALRTAVAGRRTFMAGRYELTSRRDAACSLACHAGLRMLRFGTASMDHPWQYFYYTGCAVHSPSYSLAAGAARVSFTETDYRKGPDGPGRKRCCRRLVHPDTRNCVC